MRTVIARIFDYSLDGVIAAEDTPFFDFCRELPDDPAMEERNQALYADADLLKPMGALSGWFALSDHGLFVKEGGATAWTRLTAPDDWRGMHPTTLTILHDRSKG